MLKKTKLCLFILFAVSVSLYSQAGSFGENQGLSGQGLSSADLFARLTGKGLSPQMESLSGSSSLLFPYNIHLVFGENAGTVFIYTALQEELSPNGTLLNALIDFALFLTENPPPYRIEIVFSSNDISRLPVSIAENMPAGIRTLSDTLDPTNPLAVILLRPAASAEPGSGNNRQQVEITAGAKNRVTPAWLTRMIISSLEKTETPFKMKSSMLSLYRLGWVAESPLLAVLLNADIPAVQIAVPDTVELLPFFKESAQESVTEMKTEWDQHYTFFNPGSGSIFIGEQILIILILAITGITLIILFCFSFVFGKKQYQYRLDFGRTWYFIPLMLLFTTVSLYLAQTGVTALYSLKYNAMQGWIMQPVAAFCLKITAGLAILTIITILQRFFRFPEDDYIYGFLVSLISLANIFIFSVIDFSLSLLFVAEYFLALLFSKTRKLGSIICSAAAMLLPFFFFIIQILRTRDTASLNILFAGSFEQNLALSLIFVPFELVFIRILVKTKRFGKRDLFYLPGFAIAFTGAAVILAAGILLVPSFSEKKPLEIAIEQNIRRTATSQENFLIVSSPLPGRTKLRITGNGFEERETDAAEPSVILLPEMEKKLSLSASRSVFLDRSRIALDITSTVKPERIDVEVKRASGYAVFDASYPFTIEDNGRICLFTLDEHPPLPLTIQFTTEKDAGVTIIVTLYSLENPGGIKAASSGKQIPVKNLFLYKEEAELFFPGSRETRRQL